MEITVCVNGSIKTSIKVTGSMDSIDVIDKAKNDIKIKPLLVGKKVSSSYQPGHVVYFDVN